MGAQKPPQNAENDHDGLRPAPTYPRTRASRRPWTGIIRRTSGRRGDCADPGWARRSTPAHTRARACRFGVCAFDKAVQQQVKMDPICRLLMTVPGIGALSSLMYVSTVEDPGRFSRSRAVGAHLGLTPRRYQSGETDRSGHISRCGDGLARTLRYKAAIVIRHRVKRSLHLKDWAEAIERRSGPGKARVALARKLSVILHSVWRSGAPFRWAPTARAA